MSSLVEAGLRRVLAEPVPSDALTAALPPLSSWNGGKELVDISNREELYKALAEE